MKTTILKYFKTDRSYRAGVSLIQQYSVKLGLKKQLNIHPQSDYLMGCVIEELREIAGISNLDLKTLLSVPVQKIQPVNFSVNSIAEHESDIKTEVLKLTGKFIPEQTKDKSKKPLPPVKKQSRKK